MSHVLYIAHILCGFCHYLIYGTWSSQFLKIKQECDCNDLSDAILRCYGYISCIRRRLQQDKCGEILNHVERNCSAPEKCTVPELDNLP